MANTKPTYEELQQELELLKKRLEIAESFVSKKNDFSQFTPENINSNRSEAILNLILRYSPILIYLKDENDKALYLSQNFEQLLGMPVNQMVGKSNYELFPTDFAKKMDEDDLKILRENETIEVEEEFNGRYFTTIKFPIQIKGKPRYLAGFSIDITERKKTEELLRDSENRFKNVFIHHSSMMFLVDPEALRIIDANIAACKFYGYSLEELKEISKDSSSSQDKHITEFREKIIGQQQDHFIVPTLISSGDERAVEVYSSPIQYEGKKILFLIIHDVTERYKAELALRENEAKIVAILNTLPDAIFIGDINGNYYDSYVPKGSTISSFMPAPHRQLKDFLPAELFDKILTLTRNAIETSEMQIIEFSLEVNGSVRFFEDRISHYADNEVVSVLRDITQRHDTEQIVRQQNVELKKINSDKDRFISILAHDLRSPFASILGFLELLNANIRSYDMDEIESQLNLISMAANKTYTLLDDLLLWVKSQAGKLSYEPEKLSLQDLCGEAVTILLNQANRKNISIEFSGTKNTLLFADSNMVKTILRNLISNAIKFTNESGAVTVFAEDDQNNATITVSDNGIGMDKDTRAKLWDMAQSFTTAGTYGEQGTGLGLLICKEFVEKHGGKIWVESEPGKGSNFGFTIPLYKG